MLRFRVFDESGPAATWPLTGAVLLGPEDVATPGRVGFKKDGLVEIRRTSRHSIALCLPYETAGCGRLMIQTCLLPDRDEPYVLSIELARHRIKQFIAKSEEWQMFDLQTEHPAMRRWEEARRLFTLAITNRDPRAADRDARASLDQGIRASERLAMAHAEILLHRRYANRPASSATLGVRVWPERSSEPLREIVASNFDVLVLPLRWKEIEVEEGTYRWGPLDAWMDWAREQGKPIVAGPLIDLSKEALPEWMYVWQHDYDTCRDLVYDYMAQIVTRYQGVVGMWNIASGVNTNANFELTSAQMLDLTRTASLLVRQIRKGARTMIELREPFGADTASRRDAMPALAYLDRVVAEGIRLDAVGVQLLFGEAGRGRVTRDLMQISNLLDRFHLLELPIIVSAMGVPSAKIDPAGGTWYEPWSPDRQARWASKMFAIALSKPYIESLFWSDLYDHPVQTLATSGLIDDAGRPKPAFARLIGLRKRLRKPIGELKTVSSQPVS